MRLDKFLANENIGSRKAVGVLVRSGAVTVNGQAVKKADVQVDPACDTVCVNGAPLRYNAHIYIMMNKPAGVLTATRAARAEKAGAVSGGPARQGHDRPSDPHRRRRLRAPHARAEKPRDEAL